MAKEKQREGKLYWVDSAKGIGVLFVILGHFLYYTDLSNLNRAIYSFHMPLFFILAGYVQKPESLKTDYIYRRIKRLLIPFMLFSIISVVFYAPSIIRDGRNGMDVALDAFYVKGRITNNPLWFLIVLFEIYFLNYVLRLSEKATRFQLIICVFSFVFGWVVYEYRIRFMNLFGLNRMIICAGFFTFGLIVKKIEYLYRKTAFLGLSIIIWVVFGCLINSKVSIYSFRLGNYVYFLIAGLAGSIAVMILCSRFLDYENILSKLSKYALLFLGTQYFLRSLFTRACQILGITGTWKVDILLVAIIGLYVLLLPPIYEHIKKAIPQIRYLNGEL